MLPGQIVHARNKTKSSVDNFPLDVATLKIQRSVWKKKNIEIRICKQKTSNIFTSKKIKNV